MDSEPLSSTIRDYLRESRELSRLCSQNGWIDNDTLHFRIERSVPGEVVVAVSFVEVLMEGAGCMADRRERFGKLRLRFDENHRIEFAEEA